ncbi:hypothetical protein ACHAWF_005092 [Thalassiosira exigua]
MDVCSKILSKILTDRAYLILNVHDSKYQFGATPKIGCQDGSFVLKTLLHLRRQHNIDTYVILDDLVKAFDTTNHKLLIEILEKYRAPPTFCDAIKRLYENLKVVLKIEKETAEISQGVGVRQSDNLSPVLFLFLMSALAETLESEWSEANLPKVRLHRASMENAEEFPKGQLTGHDKETLSRGTPLDLSC